MPSAGAFELQASFDASVAALNAGIFVVPLLVALLVEGPLLLWCERFARARVLGLGLAGMGLGALGCALAPDLGWFAAGFSVYATASGIACGVAQAALMDADPEHREQRMAEWATAGWIGDFGGPLLLWASAACGFGWRGAYVGVASALVLAGLGFGRRALPRAAEEDDGEEPTLAGTLRLLGRRRSLFFWLFGVALCSLLDELVAVLIGLRIDSTGGNVGDVSRALLAFTAGGVVGLLVLGRLLRRVSPQRLLVGSCIGCALATAGWTLHGHEAAMLLLLALSGAFAALHYPIAQAQAYAALPERSTLVAAAAQPFLIFDLSFPLVVGWIADAYGLTPALLFLLVQPLGLALIAATCWKRAGAPIASAESAGRRDA